MARRRFYLVGIVLALWLSCSLMLASGQLTHPSEVDALQAVRRNLKDTGKNLKNWKKTDPCLSNWTGVICTMDPNDGYLHVQQLRFLNMKLAGKLAPELGLFSRMILLDFSWNNVSGRIPKEIGNVISLMALLLSANQLSGPLPEEFGSLTNLLLLSLDDNYISGPIPKSFANMTSVQHFHLNNNSISGQIPPELSALPNLIHLLLDNNNLSGYLPPELSKTPNLRILQLDNNNFQGTEIPVSYTNMSKLVKLSLRNCSLKGSIPDLSSIPRLLYVDLSWNQLSGSIPTNRLANNVTTFDLSNNMLTGPIPANFSGLPLLQRLSLENNMLSGSVPSPIWQNVNFGAKETLILDFQNNSLTNISGTLDPPSNVTIRLQGNPVCSSANQLNIVQFCGLNLGNDEVSGSSNNSFDSCPPQSCPASLYREYVPESPVSCFCALPLDVEIRLKSPSISDFRPYMNQYRLYMTSGIGLDLYQLLVDSFIWQTGPRLLIHLKFFPQFINDSTSTFNNTELHRIMNVIATFALPLSDIFGPYEVLDFTLLGPYADVRLEQSKSGISKGAIVGIVLGSIAGVVAISLAILFLYNKKTTKHKKEVSKKQPNPKVPIKTESVRGFGFTELEEASSWFSATSQIGHGGYGKVYKGILADGTVVAIKRAHRGSLQGQREFLTEIELLSRLHHRNLASLVGYCDEEGDQMLVYEFMPNGSLQDLLNDRFRKPFSFAMRLHIALGAAKGILYLHTEANPPIIHRDIKANNILLDSKYTAKVSDFGISRLAPVSNVEGAVCYVSTVVKGTPGYLDPEYFLTHQLTEKSDVYSLGIVFLELLTGMKPIFHGKHIVREVNASLKSETMFSIIDKSMGPYSSECLKRFVVLALKCCEDERETRPSMLEVVRELEDISSMLQESDTIPTTNSDVSATSSTSGVPSSSLYSRRNSYVSGDFPEVDSELVSGVVPTIRPR